MAAASPAASPTRTPSRPNKWLMVDEKQIRIELAGSKPIKALEDKTINLVTVWGKARTGKSFLMNSLLGRTNFFEVDPAPVHCTVGADLSDLMSYRAFAGRDGGPDSIGLVDVEGYDDSPAKHQLIIAGSLLLVSKAVIMNWHGKTARKEMLDKLTEVILVAKRFKKAASVTPTLFEPTKIFGHLHIVLRDSVEADGVHDYLFKDEDGTDKDTKNRNAARKLIRESFATYEVHPLPPPVVDSRKGEKGDFTEKDTCAEFNQAVSNLKTVLAIQLREPRLIKKTPVTGKRLTEQMIKYSNIDVDDEFWAAVRTVGGIMLMLMLL